MLLLEAKRQALKIQVWKAKNEKRVKTVKPRTISVPAKWEDDIEGYLAQRFADFDGYIQWEPVEASPPVKEGSLEAVRKELFEEALASPAFLRTGGDPSKLSLEKMLRFKDLGKGNPPTKEQAREYEDAQLALRRWFDSLSREKLAEYSKKVKDALQDRLQPLPGASSREKAFIEPEMGKLQYSGRGSMLMAHLFSGILNNVYLDMPSHIVEALGKEDVNYNFRETTGKLVSNLEELSESWGVFPGSLQTVRLKERPEYRILVDLPSGTLDALADALDTGMSYRQIKEALPGLQWGVATTLWHESAHLLEFLGGRSEVHANAEANLKAWQRVHELGLHLTSDQKREGDAALFDGARLAQNSYAKPPGVFSTYSMRLYQDPNEDASFRRPSTALVRLSQGGRVGHVPVAATERLAEMASAWSFFYGRPEAQMTQAEQLLAFFDDEFLQTMQETIQPRKKAWK